MSVANITKQLKALSYADMMQLAEMLSAQLQESGIPVPTQRIVADALSRIAVAAHSLEPSDLSKQEERILQQIFKVKRTIIPLRHKGGWALSVPTIQGSQIAGAELRPLWGIMLDQIITLHIMSKQ